MGKNFVCGGRSLSRLADIYVAMVSSTHNVCAKDIYIAIVSTIVETSTPELELRPGLDLLGPIHDKCVLLSIPYYDPIPTLYDLGSSPLLPYTPLRRAVGKTTSSSPARMMPLRTSRLLWTMSRTYTSASRAMILYLRRGSWTPTSNRHEEHHVYERNGFLLLFLVKLRGQEIVGCD